jgi:hypothetical protein
MIIFTVNRWSGKELQIAECMGQKSPAYKHLCRQITCITIIDVLVDRALSFG